MTKEQTDFMREHKRFIWFHSLSIWNGEQIREWYTKDELILHEMLYEEVFYVWNDSTVGCALMYIRDAYPDVTEKDLRRVYDAKADFVTEIYG